MSLKKKRIAVNVRLYGLFTQQKRKKDGSVVFNKEQIDAVVSVIEEALNDDGIYRLKNDASKKN